ncbi:MAG: hypothetical protein M1828_005442 [Chrysothrix sp. TS-e1954]|nr:MAG: hypothetical protein M1828_005442 [Chrysothrix sp. TS-e1954]
MANSSVITFSEYADLELTLQLSPTSSQKVKVIRAWLRSSCKVWNAQFDPNTSYSTSESIDCEDEGLEAMKLVLNLIHRKPVAPETIRAIPPITLAIMAEKWELGGVFKQIRPLLTQMIGGVYLTEFDDDRLMSARVFEIRESFFVQAAGYVLRCTEDAEGNLWSPFGRQVLDGPYAVIHNMRDQFQLMRKAVFVEIADLLRGLDHIVTSVTDPQLLQPPQGTCHRIMSELNRRVDADPVQRELKTSCFSANSTPASLWSLSVGERLEHVRRLYLANDYISSQEEHMRLCPRCPQYRDTANRILHSVRLDKLPAMYKNLGLV